jgi:ABC-type multidrug transport system fused ATPase/permease subunit
MSIVLDLARRFWWRLGALMALESLGAVLALLAPIPLQIAVDTVVEKKPLPAWLAPALGGSDLLVGLALFSVGVALLTQAQGVGSGILSTLVGQRLIATLRTRLFDAALRLSLRRHIQKGVTDALYRIQSDAQTVEWILLDGALPVFTAVVTLAAMLTALFRLNPLLGAIGLVVAPPLLLLARLLRPALKAGARTARERESRALAVVQESLGALAAVKAFGREDAEVARFGALAEQGVRARLRVAWLDGLLGAGVQVLCATGTALALYVGIQAVQQGRLTLGQALLGLHYVNQVYGPLKTLGRKWASMQTQVAGLERAMELLHEPSDVPELPDARSIARARGALTLDAVTFGYDERRPVLACVDLWVREGERVGIVGETGAGKTTLMSLLLRLYDPVEGRVLLDGDDIRTLRIADLRRQFAVVFQETVLFQGTIAENIAVGRPGAGDDEIHAAARAANLHEAIGRLPDGYETAVGERGHALSGGERQRVGLARAFLRDAPVLILDEPTSALDASTEAGVLEALDRLMTGRTVLIITHRLQALTGCHRVVRVDGGRLVPVIDSHPAASTVVAGG